MSRFRKEFRLTPFEEYMFWDETPAFPMTSWQRFRFSGRLDPGLLLDALRAAAARHPLMNARIELRCGRPYWRFDSAEPDILFYKSEDEEKGLIPPDIRKSHGLGVFYRAWEEDGRPMTDLGFSVHHSVSDGMGNMSFFEDLFLNYAAKKGTPVSPDAYQVLSPESMSIRQAPGQTWKRYFRLLSHGIKSTRDMLLHDAKPFLPIKKIDYTTPVVNPNRTELFYLTPEETLAYRTRAKAEGLSLNDRLMCDFFRACGDFERKFVPEKNRWIRVAMPVNMRPADMPNIFAANVVSMVFLDRRPSQITDDEAFAQEIHRETDWIKKTDQGYALLVNLRSKRNTFGGIRIVLHGRRCWSTTVLSNLGILFSKTPLPHTGDGRLIVGDTVLESFCGMPPFRAKTFTGCGVWTYAGRLGFGMRYDERYLTDEQSMYAFNAFKERVKNYIATPDHK